MLLVFIASTLNFCYCQVILVWDSLWRFRMQAWHVAVNPQSNKHSRVTVAVWLCFPGTLGPAYNEFGYNELPPITTGFLASKSLAAISILEKIGYKDHPLTTSNSFTCCKQGPVYPTVSDMGVEDWLLRAYVHFGKPTAFECTVKSPLNGQRFKFLPSRRGGW